MPWATWYEDTTGAGFDAKNIFASRFDNTGDVNQGKWIFAGQSRGTGGGTVPVPSLNIHTDQDAENPSVAGGSAADPTKPGPWVTWQETARTRRRPARTRSSSRSRSAPGQTNCTGVKPAAADPTALRSAGSAGSRSGVERLGAPIRSLNVDPTRDGIEPDIAFTGPNDSVPWVVWYEQDASAVSGAATTTRWCSPPRAPRRARRPDGDRRRWLQLDRCRQRSAGRARRPGRRRLRRRRSVGRRAEKRVLAERQPDRGRRGPARRRRDDEPRQRDGAVGGLGRGRSPASSRSSSRGWCGTGAAAIRARQQRRADLDRAPTTRRARTSRSRATRRT